MLICMFCSNTIFLSKMTEIKTSHAQRASGTIISCCLHQADDYGEPDIHEDGPVSLTTDKVETVVLRPLSKEVTMATGVQTAAHECKVMIIRGRANGKGGRGGTCHSPLMTQLTVRTIHNVLFLSACCFFFFFNICKGILYVTL